MAAGFTLPEVKFLSIVLRGGTELSKKVDEPHIAQQGDFGWTAAITNPSDTDLETFQAMKVDVTLAIKVGFDVTSKNIYASFFKNDFAKYLKPKIGEINKKYGVLARHCEKNEFLTFCKIQKSS